MGFFLTEQSQETPIRRRDPFGFAKIANHYADLLAPGITNRNRDARWITILCWSLRQVEDDFAYTSQDEAYNYLRGLELRWIIEACHRWDRGRGRQLPGSRAVRDCSPGIWPRLREEKMGDDQWRRYQYVGPYASYRGLMQEMALLEDDGLTLTSEGKKLSRIIPLQTTNCRRQSNGDWVDYWLRRWPIGQRRESILPRTSTSLRLPVAEANILNPLLFAVDDDAKRREVVAKTLEGTRSETHSGMCTELQQRLQKTSGWAEDEQILLQQLGSFAAIADSAVDVLKKAFRLIKQPIDVGSAAKKMGKELCALQNATNGWSQDKVWPDVDSFALRLNRLRDDGDFLAELICLHEERGGGQRWVALSNGQLDRAVRFSDPPYGFYRFRLESLGRLAVGVGIIKQMPPVFRMPDDEEED